MLAIPLCLGRCSPMLALFPLLSPLLAFAQSPPPAAAPQRSKGCYRVAVIILSGNGMTDDAFILREVQVRESATYCHGLLQEKLQKSRFYLYNTTLFHAVDIFTVEISAGEVAVFVGVKERGTLYLFPGLTTGRYNFAYWYRRLGGAPSFLNYSLYARHINATGRADRLDLLVKLGAVQLADVSYNYAYLGSQKQFNVKGRVLYSFTRWIPYSSHNHRPIYVLNQENSAFRGAQASLEVGYRPYWQTRHTIALGYNNASITDGVYEKNPYFFQNRRRHRRSFSLAYGLQMDTRDNSRYPLMGQYVSFSFRRLGIGWLNKHGLWSAYSSFFRYLPLHRRLFLHYEMLNYYTYPQYTGYYLRTNLNALRRYVLRGYGGSLIEGSAFSLARTQLKFFLCALRMPLSGALPHHDAIARYTDDPVVFRFYPFLFADTAWVVGYPTTRLPVRNNTLPAQPLNDILLYTLGAGVDVVTFYDFTGSFFYSWNRQNKHSFGANVIY